MNSINWTSEFNIFLGTIGNFESVQFLDLDGTPKPIKCLDKPNKGRTFYIGDWKNGYKIQHGTLYKIKIMSTKNSEKEILTLVYKGKIEVLACEIDADTGNHKLVIQFLGDKDKLKTVSVPLEEVATGRGVIANLAKRGAKIEERQARLVSEYLIRFYEHNDHIIPTFNTTQFLGVSGDGIITPLKSVGTDTKYTGPLKLSVGDDKEAYPNAIKEIVSWGEPAWPLLFTLSMSLISPFLTRFKLRRNPIIAFVGQSNSGKTTSALFANGVWGDSERAPFKVDGSGKTTTVGLEQNQLLLNGLPWLLDEIHKMRDFMIESTIYEWANKQTRVYGSPGGTPKGGTPLNGTLLLCGEDLPNLTNKGATNRLLMIDVATNPPLGIGGKIKNDEGQLVSNPEGARRAKVLENAWTNGMGLLGADFSEYLLKNWDAFYSKYQHNLKNINGAIGLGEIELGEWAKTAAISTTTLEYLFSYLGINDKSVIGLMPTKISGLLHEYRTSEKDPDIAAWDSLQTMIGVASENQGVWQLSNETVWWKINRLDGTECYCVPIGTQAFKRYVGAASKYTQSWLNSGLIIGWGKDGDKVSNAAKNPDTKKKVKCLLIPIEKDIETTSNQVKNSGCLTGCSSYDKEVIDNNNKYIHEQPEQPKQPVHTHTQTQTQESFQSDDQSFQNHKTIFDHDHNTGDNGDNGDNGDKTQHNQSCNVSPTLSQTLSPENKSVVSGCNREKVADPNKPLTKKIMQYLNKKSRGSLDDLIFSLDDTEKYQQAIRVHIEYLKSQEMLGTYDNQSGYVSVYLVD